jgi:hypothetical protein
MVVDERIIVRELSRLDRGALEKHFLSLGAEDRRLRFGIPFGDAGVCAYVARINYWGVHALFMHCLSENQTITHLARKQGMEIVAEHGEADAWLKLQPANASSHLSEVFAQRIALFDQAFKTQLFNARRIAEALGGAPTSVSASPVPEK